MCGIAGIVRWDGRPPAIEDVQAMCDVMVHRGPDDEGYYGDGHAALGMRRLNIIDRQTGHQPWWQPTGCLHFRVPSQLFHLPPPRTAYQSQDRPLRKSEWGWTSRIA